MCIPIEMFNSQGVNKADFRFAPSQGETTLLCNDVSHWLGANLESVLVKLFTWEVHSTGILKLNDRDVK